MKIVVQLEAFNPGEKLDNFRDQLKSSGALVSFSGMVRDIPGGLAKIKINAKLASYKHQVLLLQL